MFVLFTDTDTDMTPEIAKMYGYHLISMPYSINGVEIKPYEDFNQFDYKTFYNQLRDGIVPTTSAVSPGAYIEYFEPFFKDGKDILYVHFSEKMSGTFNSMHIAIEELKERYPERNIYTIDTKGISICSYNILKEIGNLYLNGASIKDIIDWSMQEIDKFAFYLYADDLKFFKRSGRVSNLSAFLGTILGIHPIIYMDKEGYLVPHTKAKGRIGSLKKIVNYVKELQDDIKNHSVIIGHTDALELAEILGKMLKEEFGDDLQIEYLVVNPTAGSHCGPDALGVCFHAIHK